MMTSEEWAVVTHAVALQLARDRIVGTDRTLPAKIKTVCAAKDAEQTRLIEAEVVDGNLLAEELMCLIGEAALLTIALHFTQTNYEQMLKDKPRIYVALHGLLTFSRTFRAAAYARWAELLSGKPVLSAAERARAVKLIQAADLGVPLG
jgi:hypothetical protein